MLPVSRYPLVAGLCAVCSWTLAAQRLSDFNIPRPLPPGSVLAVGFLGGIERFNNELRSVRRIAIDLRSHGIYAETASNRNRKTAVKLILKALDTNRNGKIDKAEAAQARVILYGHSLGGSAVVATARDLARKGIPVLLTVQVDSVGFHDDTIPPNVRAAANFYQHDWFSIRGASTIRAEDPSRTRILGNFRSSYYFRTVDPAGSSWLRRNLGGSHSKMELDRGLWDRVERLILDASNQ